MITTNYNP